MQFRPKIDNSAAVGFVVLASFAISSSSFATTKGLSQIVTPDLQSEGDLSLSLQIQDKRIANPYEIQSELGLTKWFEVAVFKGFQPNELIFGTEIALIQKEPYLHFQSGSGNSSTIGFTCNLTRDLQFNPAIYVTNDSPHHVLGYIVFTYTFHLWDRKDEDKVSSAK